MTATIRWAASIVALVLVVLAHSATLARAGVLLYSVDTATDELVTIDAGNGQVTVIGGLGRNITNIDLAMHNGNLYGIDTYVGNRVELLQIDKITGQATYLADLTRGPDTVLHAEALTSKSGILFVGFNVSGSASSNRLGELALDGTIASDAAVATDLDALATSSSSVLYSADSNPNVRLYSLQPLTFIGSHSETVAGRVNDIAFAGNSLYGIGQMVSALHVIDPGDGSLLGTVALSRSGTYFGLAVPEPSTLCLSLLASLVLLACRRRSSRL